MKTITISLLLLLATLHAAEHKASIKHQDYDTALDHRDHIHFTMESTKLGVISSEFTGVVKAFDVKFDSEGKSIRNGSISFNAADMDTDLDARNRKMLELCLNQKKFPTIKVDFTKATLTLDAAAQNVKGNITIRGKSFPIEATITATREKDGIRIKGSSSVKLSTLKIPDPSIAVASVRDRVDLSFQILVK